MSSSKSLTCTWNGRRSKWTRSEGRRPRSDRSSRSNGHSGKDSKRCLHNKMIRSRKNCGHSSRRSSDRPDCWSRSAWGRSAPDCLDRVCSAFWFLFDFWFEVQLLNWLWPLIKIFDLVLISFTFDVGFDVVKFWFVSLSASRSTAKTTILKIKNFNLLAT